MQKRTSRLAAAATAAILLAGMNTATMALPLAAAQPVAGSAHASVIPVRYRHHGHWGHGGWGGGWGWSWGGPALGLGLLGLGLAAATANNNHYASEGGYGPSDCIRHHGQLYCR